MAIVTGGNKKAVLSAVLMGNLSCRPLVIALHERGADFDDVISHDVTNFNEKYIQTLPSKKKQEQKKRLSYKKCQYNKLLKQLNGDFFFIL